MYTLYALPDGSFSVKQIDPATQSTGWIIRRVNDEKVSQILMLTCGVPPIEIMKAFKEIDLNGVNVVEFGFNKTVTYSKYVDFLSC
jgi:hypothetical protein